YSLLLHHCDFQFTASFTDGAIALSENGEFSSNDRALLQKLLRHLETASKRGLVRRPRSNNSLWQRLFKRMRLPQRPCKCLTSRAIHAQKSGPSGEVYRWA